MAHELTDEQRDLIRIALAIHPVHAAIITNPSDAEFAGQFASQVWHLKKTDTPMPELVREFNGPIVVVTNQETPLLAVYEDGSEENIACY
jgi:hypothetical protein